MPLLKIGKKYLNTDLIVAFEEVTNFDGERGFMIDVAGDTSYELVPSDAAEIDALLRWLDENSTDIMATADPQPAPAKVEICEGDTVGIIGTKYFGEVLRIRDLDGGRQYFLKRAYTPSENQFLGWFAENMLDPENNVPDEYATPAD